MLRARIVPCLLLEGTGLVKTICFKDASYVGDPINALRLFNEKEVDELILLDISAGRAGAQPKFDLIRDIVSEAFMPIAYGGGVDSVEAARRLVANGVEKVVVNTAALRNPSLISDLSRQIGTSSTVVAIDIARTQTGVYRVFDPAERKLTDLQPEEHARRMAEAGAGEIFINDVDRDGTGLGYDAALIERICRAVKVPVIACGGAGKAQDLRVAVDAGAAAAAAGSLFVYIGKQRAVMINYPNYDKIREILSDG
jgi:cyclase